MDLKCLGLTKRNTQALERLLNTLSYEQKEVLFEEMDKTLHDETWKDLDNKVITLEIMIDEYSERNEVLEELNEQRAM